ncbi:homoserine O-acetyltransferase MetX [Mycobacterium sp. IDR2000157661]|uniref:homoserine O-acetyltransferase MetX n=1 Tax=Mycobacterium sp. IDR2000157661 TaxID=2867005 RepID=UPI001EEAD824|nr:homoserine O-acetyltransferase [Mycobacterium sp. IDR2000157661]ULE33715.1 homoserine O-acetyltransferase [Mycobacterium sp. IDR2000157661]
MTIFDVEADVPLVSLPDEGEIGVVDIGPLTLENGTVLDDVSIAVQRWGELSPTRDNVVVVLHALTGDSYITGPAVPDHPTGGWWDGVAGPGAAIDTDRWCAVATNVLGGCRGSTGPGSLHPDGKAWGSRFPAVSIRDQVQADIAALAALGITEVAAVVGGSMGGARALEWIVGHPDKVRSALVLAVGARATADQIGTQCSQVAAIKSDPNWQNGDYYGTGLSPDTGMEIARRFAHLTYRGEMELDTRFANDPQGAEDPGTGGRYAVQSYLEHQGRKLVARFDAGTYVTLTDSLSSHDVGRGRGGVEAALRGCPVPVVVGGITSDRLYPLRLQQELAELLPNCRGLDVVESIYGHDGFLVETEAVYKLIRQTLELASRR